MTKSAVIIAFMLTLIPPVYAQEKSPLLTLQEKLSYSLGSKAGTSLTRELIQQNIETNQINLDMFLKGFNDGFLSAPPLLEEAELRGALLEFQKQRRNLEMVKQQLKRIAALLSTYRSDLGEYPSSLTELVTNSTNHKLWKGPYIENETFLKDPWGFSYQYHYPGRHKHYGLYNYDLFSYGPDGIEGGQEENSDILFQISTEQNLSLNSSNQKSETPTEENSEVMSSEEAFHTLQLFYKHNSWTRIVDSRNQELFSGVAKGGENVFVKGLPPFQLKFGRTEGITVEYRGEKFLLEGHPHLKNGRMTLGQEK